MSPENPFVLGLKRLKVKVTWHVAQRQCRRGILHCCEFRLLLDLSLSCRIVPYSLCEELPLHTCIHSIQLLLYGNPKDMCSMVYSRRLQSSVAGLMISSAISTKYSSETEGRTRRHSICPIMLCVFVPRQKEHYVKRLEAEEVVSHRVSLVFS